MGSTALGIAVMLLATSLVNTGMVLQKRAVDRLPSFEHTSLRQSVLGLLRAPLWVIGYALGSVALFLNMAALAMADVSVIQPLNGFGLVVLVVLSRLLLGERVDRWTLLGVLLVIGGVGVVGFLLPPGRGFESVWELFASYTRPSALAGLGGLLVLGLAAWAWARRAGRLAGMLLSLAAAAASVGGLTFSKGVFLGAGLAGGAVVLTGGAWWLLLGLLLSCSTAALVLQQLSFQKGRAVEVTTLFNAASVILPIGTGRAVFAEHPPALTLLGALLIAGGVVLIGMRRPAAP